MQLFTGFTPFLHSKGIVPGSVLGNINSNVNRAGAENYFFKNRKFRVGIGLINRGMLTIF